MYLKWKKDLIECKKHVYKEEIKQADLGNEGVLSIKEIMEIIAGSEYQLKLNKCLMFYLR